MKRIILLDEGSGGKASHRLVKDLFLRYFSNPALNKMDDGAILSVHGPVAMSTDGYTVDPVEFAGGNIGSLAIHGTVNDVSMMGARPLYLSCGFILEEGLPFDVLERIVESMATAAQHAGVFIVTGDTKVVPRGAADKIFITTTGIGEVIITTPPSGSRAMPGDVVILSGTVGDHGLAVMSGRTGLTLAASVHSDSASLNHVVLDVLQEVQDVHVLRDPTRGGLATTLNEIAAQSGVDITIQETAVPIHPDVAGGCSVLGLDPLYLANEGKFICIVPEKEAAKVLSIIRRHPEGENAVIIGAVSSAEKKATAPGYEGRVLLETTLGGHRLLGVLEGEQLPRIC